MYELTSERNMVVVLPEVLDELAARVRAEQGSSLHNTLTSGGTLQPRHVQLLASVIDPDGDATIAERGLRFTITPSVGKVISEAADTGRCLTIKPCR